MYRIAKTFGFSASHQLDYLPKEHKCSRLHGHNYKVTLILASENLDKDHFVKDFGELSGFAEWLKARFDHRHLNDCLVVLENPHTQPRGAKPFTGGMDQRYPIAPTSENIANYIYKTWKMVYPQLECVRVSEGEYTWAEYSE